MDWKRAERRSCREVPPTDDRESAIVATLSPDSYTAIVGGKNNTTGVGLVDVYNISP
jgi:hypothetical protein